jgi:ATP-binding cassette subfamily C protein
LISRYKKVYALFDRRDKILYSGLFVLMIIGAFLEVAGISAVPAFVATLAVPEQIREYPMAAEVLDTLGITSAREMVIWGASAMIVVYGLKNAFLTFLAYAQARMTEHQRVRLATHLFREYMEAPYEFHLSRNSAELLRNVNVETKEIISGIVNPVLNLVLAVVMTGSIVALLILTTPWIALVGVALVGVSSWAFMRILKKRMTYYGKEAKKERKESIKAVNQGLGAFQPTRVLGRESYFVKAYHDSIARFAKYRRFLQTTRGSTSPYLEFVAVTGLMVIVFSLIITGTDLRTMIPMLGLYGAAIARLRGTVSGIANSINQVRFSMAAVDAVVDDLWLLEDEKRSAEASRVQRRSSDERRLHLDRSIDMEEVTYRYPNTEVPALDNITLSIEKGSSVAFVGATGSGKTTLVNVILGLLIPQEGSIAVDGTEIHSNLRAWQANLGYIPQEIYLLDDTIRRNIAFGVPDEEIDDQKVWKAIRAAQLEDFILDLPEGLETEAGERGVRISGGQRQRVGLARALYHDPEVLVMDEATSALDNETEQLVMQAINSLKNDRTLIMIAHRLTTVRDCDELFFLKKGQIEATGTYEELRALSAEFQQMAGVA